VADVNPASLLSSLAAGTGRAVLLDARGVPLAGTPEAFSRVQRAGLTGHPRGIAPGDPAPPGWAWALVAVAPASFEPPVRWWLARAEREQDLFAGLGSLTAGYRAALVLNVLAVVSTVLLGVALVHLAQRRARLEEAAAHGARQRALEARLAEVDRLAAVGRVAATLAHEVRNPLEGMRNWLALVEDEARAAGADGVLPHAARVREGIDHLGEVVRRVLALARPSAGHRDPLDLDALVRETVADVATWKPFRAVRIDCSLHGSLPAVRGDRVLLGQALLNLLLNARDASPEGAKVEVATAVDGREVVLRVRDHGPGIAPEVRSRLFQPFASAKGSTGLGLALCDRVARAHGGRVEAGDAVDGGAAFALRLPIEGTVIPAVDEEAP
jgi:two-component system sensor histidine kinase HydH